MARVAYVNGRYVLLTAASVSIEDRGFQFADGVYEVWAVFGGKLADSDGHFVRLARSLSALGIVPPMSRSALAVVLGQTLRRNRIGDGLLYLQITRGVARRDHAFPAPVALPTLVVTARPMDFEAAQARAVLGVAVHTLPDNRWGRCDIKTVGLLANVLAKQAAREAGAYEAWFVDGEGLVTEGASTSAWIVDRSGVLRTRGPEANILRGVTGASLAALAEAQGYDVSDRPFTVAEAKAAREAFVSAAGTLVMPVVRIDGVPVGDGRPGPVATALRSIYIQHVRNSAQ